MLHEGNASVLTHSANVAVNSRLTTVQTNGDRQPVAPVKPWPPHWPYSATVPTAAEDCDGGAALVVGCGAETVVGCVAIAVGVVVGARVPEPY